MNFHNLATPEYVTARKALVQELTWLRDQYALGVSNGREMFAAACGGTDEFTLLSRDRLRADYRPSLRNPTAKSRFRRPSEGSGRTARPLLPIGDRLCQ